MTVRARPGVKRQCEDTVGGIVTFALEALQAYDGDCLLLHYGEGKLILIDGGPTGTYQNVLRDRLDQLRGDAVLKIQMAIVSHIDADHITGMVQLFKDLATAEENGDPPTVRVRTLWHNSFEKLVGGTKASMESGVVGAAVGGTAGAWRARLPGASRG